MSEENSPFIKNENLESDDKALNRDDLNYFNRLRHQFGLKYITFIFIVYGLTQGLSDTFIKVGGDFFFSDPLPIGISIRAQSAQKVLAFADIPWQAKSVFGLCSDFFPILGYTRTYYVFISAVIGFLGMLPLCYFYTNIITWQVGIVLFLLNISKAVPDALLDASIAVNCREHPKFAADLQTLNMIFYSLGAIFASLTGSSMYSYFSSRGIFVAVTLTTATLFYPSLNNWIGDKLEDRTSKAVSLPTKYTSCVVKLSAWFLLSSVCLGVAAELKVLSTLQLVLFACIVLIFLTSAVYYYLSQISVKLAKYSCFMLLCQSLQPSSIILTYWYRDVYPHCNQETQNLQISPCFSSTFLGNLSLIGNVCYLLAAIFYNKYLSESSFQYVAYFAQILLLFAGIVDYILVSRVNLTFNLPDYFFVIGDEALFDAAMRISALPMFILTAALCPEGIEASLFALAMGLYNFGTVFSTFLGMGLLEVLDLSRESSFNNLDTYIVIRSLFRLIPFVLIPLLVPKGSPDMASSPDFR